MRFLQWVLALAVVAVPGWAAESPNPRDILIEKVNYNGNGCRPGSVATSLAPDAKAFTLMFDDYIVDTSKKPVAGENDPDDPNDPNPRHRGCNLILDIRVPQGWSFALFNVDVRGYAQLGPKAVGIQRTAYLFRGGEVEIGKMELKGPKAADYFHRTTSPLNSLEFSPCEGKTRKLVVRTDIRVKGRGVMTVDSTDGELKQYYSIAWRKCPARKP